MAFVTDDDINELENNGVDARKHIAIFITELTAYFNNVWLEEHFIKEKPTSLDELNKKHLSNYPSNSGYRILDESFTGDACPINILSDESKRLLGYFYNIQLHSS
jgi:hypothetical protein